MARHSVHVHCSFCGDSVEHIETVLIPSLADATEWPVLFCAINSDPLSDLRLSRRAARSQVDIVNVENTTGRSIGFAEAHNVIFDAARPADHFIRINPDCFFAPGAIDALVARKAKSGVDVAIVEGRQWPFEYPKEFDPETLETPWASGAFNLIDAKFYAEIGGMDPSYFLYLEDVDLSWRAWLGGWRVLYERNAVAGHFTGSKFCRPGVIEDEHYFSLRNFIVLSRKFFGEAGQERAIELVRKHADESLRHIVVADYMENFRQSEDGFPVGAGHRHVKILGLNLFHEIRTA